MKTEWVLVCEDVKKQRTPDLNLRNDLGEAIRRQRAVLDISQDKLANRSGLHRTYISDIERGARNPTVGSIQKIARALQVPVAKLFEQASDGHR